ncbi:MAG: winged helix-turn-helix domain-containing protein [Actinomycetota bacterium]|jgi:DNA-binding transcriptional ArsR family regulator|nr:winged helix-turn-helix transcriptional regulator [Rubrobacter sp.]MDQ3508659.1 winged helix-turn-helix domain-containing protein [Actinomycetota bacterium]
MSGRRSKPDYELDEVLGVRDPEQFKAVGDPTRHRIIILLSEKAATTSQLAEALEQPKGSVGHHLKVLEDAGLIRVVRTRQVRAMTEKYYGRTARFFDFGDPEGRMPEKEFIVDFFRQVMDEYEGPDPDGEFSDLQALRHARIPASEAREFQKRVAKLAEEFDGMESVAGERVYGFLYQVYLTDLPEIPEEY